MASFTFGVGHPFPVGTTVVAYEDRGQNPSGEPVGVSTASGIVGVDGALAIAGLTEGKQYWAVAQVDGDWIYVHLTMRTAEFQPGDPLEVYDEGTQLLPLRRKITFDGAGVTALDDAVNERTRVVISGSTPGPPGAGAGVDVWASQANPEAVADWGPIINALVAAGNKALFFQAKDFPYSTQLNLSGISGLRWTGVIGRGWFTAASGFTRLRWTGTGSTGPVDISFASDLTFERIAFQYTAAATGNYFNGAHQTNATFRGCSFSYAAQGQSITLARFFDLQAGINAVFEDCTFEGALNYITGWPTGNPGSNEWENTAKFRNVVFQGQTQYSVINPGDSWVFDNCIFESVEASGLSLLAHIWINDAPGDWGVSITLRDCTHWDATHSDHTPDLAIKWVKQDSGKSARVYMDNCVEHNPAQTVSLDFQGNGHITIVAGAHGVIDFGDGASSGSKKQSIGLLNPSLSRTPLNLNKGHQNVFDGASYDFQNENTGGWSQFTNHIGVPDAADNRSTFNKSTVAPAAGAPSGTAVHEKRGNDRAGYIVVRNDSGGALAAGVGLEITQANPYVVPFNGGTVRPRVKLTPANANAVAMGAYVPDPTTVDKWRIGWANATLPAGQTAAWNYEVVYSAD